jgi:hypothetical protein
MSMSATTYIFAVYDRLVLAWQQPCKAPCNALKQPLLLMML